MQTTLPKFHPPFWLRNGHVQTVLAKFYPRSLPLQTRVSRLELVDGDFVDCHWVGEGSGPIVIVLHGLEGSIDSHYAQGILHAVQQQGWRAVLMHFRGCGGVRNRLPRAYHSGDTADLAALVAHVQQHAPATPLFAVGYSLGGNVLLKWLGELQHAAPLQAAVAVCVPYQLAPAVQYIDQGLRRIYQRRFVGELKRKMAVKIKQHQLTNLEENFAQIKTLYEFDDQITARLHGFKNADDYYQRASCWTYLKHIQVPTLLIHALDDPVIPQSAIPSVQQLSATTQLELSTWGGHVGFIQSPGMGQRLDYWLEQRIPHYLQAQLAVQK